jgi:signal recognition particle subunit SRP54
MFESLTERFSSLVASLNPKNLFQSGTIDEITKQIHDTLLDADVPVALINDLLVTIQQKFEELKKQNIARLKPQEAFAKILYDELHRYLAGNQQAPVVFQKPATLMVIGLQGSGKTTSLAKLGLFLHEEQLHKHKKAPKILVASLDFYRPAAIDQLEILVHQSTITQANLAQAKIDFYRAAHTDIAAAAREISEYRTKHGYEYLLLDTAGRLHIQQELLQELASIEKIIKPTHTLLVLDAMLGQESLTITQTFCATVPVTGAILTKTDSQSKAGVAFTFAHTTGKPIIFMGHGEHLGDFERFYPERIAQRIIGMGDINSLIEQAQKKISDEEQKRVEKSFKSNKFTLIDFANYIDMMGRFDMSSMVRSMPMMGKSMPKIDDEKINQAKLELKRFKAIISSMTMNERVMPSLINGSRRQRIASGAGVVPQDITKLLAKFEEMQQFAKLFKRGGLF